jgi:hypothetical protein
LSYFHTVLVATMVQNRIQDTNRLVFEQMGMGMHAHLPNSSMAVGEESKALGAIWTPIAGLRGDARRCLERQPTEARQP